mmetsp:Transcript_48558/g.106069  ORF Transcript_48558/g.106069 Transcript_48558/m.106069 type:complete len:207 (+) Transcript_48558:581-1201(+)
MRCAMSSKRSANHRSYSARGSLSVSPSKAAAGHWQGPVPASSATVSAAFRRWLAALMPSSVGSAPSPAQPPQSSKSRVRAFCSSGSNPGGNGSGNSLLARHFTAMQNCQAQSALMVSSAARIVATQGGSRSGSFTAMGASLNSTSPLVRFRRATVAKPLVSSSPCTTKVEESTSAVAPEAAFAPTPPLTRSCAGRYSEASIATCCG